MSHSTSDEGSPSPTPDQRSASSAATPASPDQVHERLDQLNVIWTTQSHPAMRTVADSKLYRDGVPGGYSKNLFLRNKKGRMWLVTLHEDRQVDLKDLGQLIGAGRVSFGSETRLLDNLGVIPGAVTPLAVINDSRNVVTAVLDSRLLTLDPLHFHPCDNRMTTTLSAAGLLAYMRSCDHEPVVLEFSS